MTRLTHAQWVTLYDAERFQRVGMAGVLAKGQRSRSIAVLAAAGLLQPVGPAVECDGDGFTIQPEREWPAYELTDAGRAALNAPRPPPDADGRGTR